MKKAILPIALIVVAVILFFIFRPEKAVGPINNSQTEDSSSINNGDEMTNENLSFPGILGNDQILNKKVIITTNKGVIEAELYGDKAPKTVSNFVYLIDNAFYDGLTFHRVEPGFVIQGGDPKGDGTGGPGYSFEDETVQGDYVRGSLAMANSGSNTNGSQFFICLEDQPSLPKKYNLFGKVTKGMDVIDQIVVGDTMESVIIEPLE